MNVTLTRAIPPLMYCPYNMNTRFSLAMAFVIVASLIFVSSFLARLLRFLLSLVFLHNVLSFIHREYLLTRYMNEAYLHFCSFNDWMFSNMNSPFLLQVFEIRPAFLRLDEYEEGECIVCLGKSNLRAFASKIAPRCLTFALLLL